MMNNSRFWPVLGFLAALVALVLSPAALATVSSTTNRVAYTGNGAVDTYSYAFKIFSNTDLLVVVRDDQDPATETTLVLTTDYTVTGVGLAAGGTVALVNGGQAWLDGDGDLKTGYTISIRRVRPLTQTTSIRNQGPYYPALHEDAFDHFVMIGQQLQYLLDFSIRKRETDETGALYIPLEADRIDKLFGWDSNGDPEAVDFTDAITIGGGLLAANNLDDLADLPTALSNLEADQPHWNAGELQGESVSASSPASGQLLCYIGSSWGPCDAGPATGGYTAPVETSIANGQTGAANISGMTADCASFSSVEYLFEIDRSTDSNHVMSVGRLSMRCKNTVWELSESISDGDAHGLILTVDQTGSIGQVQYESDTLAGSNYAGSIKFGRFSFDQ